MMPVGISPVVTIRHNAMSSFRASATIMVVFRAISVRAVPLRERVIFLEPQKPPSELNKTSAQPRIAGFR